jgi:hypothetical protein
MKYNYEPLIDNFFDYAYPFALDSFKEESQGIGHRMYMDGIIFSFDDWEEREHSKLKPIFEKDYNLLTENKDYFFGCSSDVYVKTYPERLNSFLIEFPDAGEIDFCEYELNKKVYYIMSELLELKIGFSIKKRSDFINDKKAQLTNQPLETESTTETETEQKTPYKIALLNELGFFKLDAIKKLTKENQYKIITALTGCKHRTIKGNVLVLDPNSNEDRIKYTSNNYTDEVKTYLDKLK